MDLAIEAAVSNLFLPDILVLFSIVNLLSSTGLTIPTQVLPIIISL